MAFLNSHAAVWLLVFADVWRWVLHHSVPTSTSLYQLLARSPEFDPQRDRISVSKFYLPFFRYTLSPVGVFPRRNSVCKFYFLFEPNKLCVGDERKSAHLIADQPDLYIFTLTTHGFTSMAIPAQIQRNSNKSVVVSPSFGCVYFTFVAGSVRCLPCGPFGLRHRTEPGGHLFHFFLVPSPLPLPLVASHLDAPTNATTTTLSRKIRLMLETVASITIAITTSAPVFTFAALFMPTLSTYRLLLNQRDTAGYPQGCPQ